MDRDDFEEFRARAYSVGTLPGIETFRRRRYEALEYEENVCYDDTDDIDKAVAQLTLSHRSQSAVTPARHALSSSPSSCTRRALTRGGNSVDGVRPMHSSCRRRSLSNRRRKGQIPRPRKLSLEAEQDMRPRTCSMPARGNIHRPPIQRHRKGSSSSHGHTPADVESDEGCPFYRVRSFTSTSRGIVNTGDTFRRKRVESFGSEDSYSERVTARRNTWSSQNQSSGYSSLASSLDAECPVPFRVIVLGSLGVGKTSLIRQFMTSEYMGHTDINPGKILGDGHFYITNTL